MRYAIFLLLAACGGGAVHTPDVQPKSGAEERHERVRLRVLNWTRHPVVWARYREAGAFWWRGAAQLDGMIADWADVPPGRYEVRMTLGGREVERIVDLGAEPVYLISLTVYDAP